MGTVYDVGDFEGALDRVLEAADYGALRTEQQRRRDAGDRVQLGIGVSCYVEITGKSVTEGPAPGGGPHPGRLQGGATVFTGTSPTGRATTPPGR